jgi:hypothetical protein
MVAYSALQAVFMRYAPAALRMGSCQSQFITSNSKLWVNINVYSILANQILEQSEMIILTWRAGHLFPKCRFVRARKALCRYLDELIVSSIAASPLRVTG